MDQSEQQFAWPMINDDLAKVFNRSPNTLRQHKLRHIKELKEHEDYIHRSVIKYSPGNLLWTENGAIKLAQYISSRESLQFLEDIGLSKHNRNRIEDDYINIISTSIEGFAKYSRQHSVHVPFGKYYIQYYIDLYIIDNKIAVECDEQDHNNRLKSIEKDRDQSITNALGCTFIRFDPYNSKLNIGTVINSIFKLIMSHA